MSNPIGLDLSTGRLPLNAIDEDCCVVRDAPAGGRKPGADRPGLVAELLAIAVADSLVGIDFSLEDWVTMLEAHNGGFATRRSLFNESARRQLDQLASGVYYAAADDGDDDEGEALELARRVDALPTLQKLAILDVIDRFWAKKGVVQGDTRTCLEALGVVFAETAHAKLRGAAARASWPQQAATGG